MPCSSAAFDHPYSLASLHVKWENFCGMEGHFLQGNVDMSSQQVRGELGFVARINRTHPTHATLCFLAIA